MTAKSDRAKEFLNNPVFQEALTNLRNEYRKHMEDARTDDGDVLELRRMLHLTHVVEKHLNQIITFGELEDFHAKEQERPSFLGDILQWPKN